MGGEYTFSSAINDSTNFSISKYRMQAVIPLHTKVKANIDWDKVKELKLKESVTLKARQDFITVNYSLRSPTTTLFDQQKIHTAAFGYTGISAGLKNGIWLYSANLYFSESSKSYQSALQPNFLGYAARIRVKNLKFVYFYGAALVYNQQLLLPVPIAGFTTKLNSRIRLTAILPVQINANYKLSKKYAVGVNTSLSGFNAVFRSTNLRNINYSHIKSFIYMSAQLNNKFQLYVEGGYSYTRKLKLYQTDDCIYVYRASPTPYIALNLKFRLGEGLIQTRLDGVD